MMAQLAYHISTGTPLWDYKVRKTTVLYFALEDDYLGRPKSNAVRQVLDGLGHVEGFHEPLVQRFFRAGGLVALLPVVQQVEIVGQHPQTVGDVCPLLVRQATLGGGRAMALAGGLSGSSQSLSGYYFLEALLRYNRMINNKPIL